MELLRKGLDCALVLVSWQPGFESELVARLEGEPPGPERMAVGLLFLWSSMAFLEAHALSEEGIPPTDYQVEDGWSSLDFLENLRWEEDRLRLALKVIRGRQVTTDIWLSRGGLFVVRTQGRGDSPMRWFESFRD
jgi:hypothetical protein